MYSQNDEETHIVKYFNGHTGRFLDIGAYDGKTFSNTYRLYELGWGGVLIEPDEKAWAGLVANYVDSDRTHLIKAALSDKNGTQVFYTSHGGAVSTTCPRHRDKWTKGGAKFDETIVDCITIDTVLQDYGEQFDFVNLDAENTNISLMKLLPFDRIKPKLVSIEYDHKVQEVKAYCAQFGLIKEIYHSSENVILGI